MTWLYQPLFKHPIKKGTRVRGEFSLGYTFGIALADSTPYKDGLHVALVRSIKNTENNSGHAVGCVWLH